jgi:hypothetical protein
MHLMLSLVALAVGLASSAWAQALPACAVGMRVPKAGALNYPATIIDADPAKGAFQVRYDGGSTEWVTSVGLRSSCTVAAASAMTDSFFVGKWEMFVGPAPQHQVIGGDRYIVVAAGATAPPLTINADGTYAWVVDGNTIINGRWRKMDVGEMKYGTADKAPAIMLMNGYSGKDWQVTRSGVRLSDKRDQLGVERMDLGLSFLATRMR